jgi:CRP-like cAMP-binding protein
VFAKDAFRGRNFLPRTIGGPFLTRAERTSSMAKSIAASASENRLLARLPLKELERLLPKLRLVPLKFKRMLTEAGAGIDSVYFPVLGVVSAITILDNGKAIEVATVGNEGLVGLTAILGGLESPHRMIVQVGGQARRMEIEMFVTEMKADTPFRRLLIRYHSAYLMQISQAVACNGLHTVQQRCCRWLLMTHDRVQGDEFPLTHDFLSQMLGVRRVSVTDVLKPLQKAGLLRNHRGMMTVLDRDGLEAASCECYGSLEKEFERLLDC